MCSACEYPDHMKMVQIRNVPDDVHRRLKSRAALEGRSLSDYALWELQRALERPTRRELAERVAARERVDVSESPADVIRSERGAR